MRFPHTGLYYYCQNLGEHVNQVLVEDNEPLMQMFLPPRKKLILRSELYHLIEKKWYKFFQPFLTDCKVWHAPFQSGRMLPNKKRFPTLKTVLTIHDLNVLYEEKHESIRQKSLAHTQLLIDQSDAIVCISEFTKRDVLVHCYVGEKPVYVIHNGVNKLPEVTGDVVGYKPAREFLLGIGYLNKKKNFHVVLPLLESNPDLEMIIIGRHDDPQYISQMKNLAQKLGVEKRLYLPGTVSEADKIWYLRNCKAFLHPSLAEGFGLPVVEAMQFGKPVFLSRFTSLPEIGGDAAFYFPDFEANVVQEVYRQGMKDYETTNRSEVISKHAAQFDWQKSARQYISIYQSLID